MRSREECYRETATVNSVVTFFFSPLFFYITVSYTSMILYVIMPLYSFCLIHLSISYQSSSNEMEAAEEDDSYAFHLSLSHFLLFCLHKDIFYSYFPLPFLSLIGSFISLSPSLTSSLSLSLPLSFTPSLSHLLARSLAPSLPPSLPLSLSLSLTLPLSLSLSATY